MGTPSAITTLRRRVNSLAPDDERAALEEARRRFAEARHALAEGADNFGDFADALGDTAEDRWDEVRKAAAPKIRSWRKTAKKSATKAKKRAAAAIGDFDAEGLRRDAKHLSADVGHRLLEFGSDVTEATRHEADRIIAQIHEAAEESRRQAEAARHKAEEAERKRRVRALIGWTAFGMVAGALLSNAVGRPKGAETVTSADAGTEDADRAATDADEVRIDDANPVNNAPR